MDITNISILVYQCIKPGSELSKMLNISTETEIFLNYLELGKQVLSSKVLQKVMFTLVVLDLEFSLKVCKYSLELYVRHLL